MKILIQSPSVYWRQTIRQSTRFKAYSSQKKPRTSANTIGDTSDLAMAFGGKGQPKKKANNDDEYSDCHKLGHFEKDCFFLDRRINKTTKSIQ